MCRGVCEEVVLSGGESTVECSQSVHYLVLLIVLFYSLSGLNRFTRLSGSGFDLAIWFECFNWFVVCRSDLINWLCNIE